MQQWCTRIAGVSFAAVLVAGPSARAMEVAQQAPPAISQSAPPGEVTPQPEYVMPATPIIVVSSYPRVRWGVGGTVGYGVRPLDFGIGAHANVGVQFSSIFGADLETIGLFGIFQIGGRVGLLADFTLAPIISLALGPSLHGATGFFASGWAVTGTARVSIRPWARTRADGVRTGFTMNLWLDVGQGESVARCNPTCATDSGVAVAGFVGIGYSRF